MNAKPILILSLVGNLALAVALVMTFKSKPVPADSGGAGPTAPGQAKATGARAKPAAEAGTTAAPAGQHFDWRLVESEDYKKYIANLRAIGCPEETIRDIIVADVNKLFDSRRRALKTASTNKFEYWKAGNFFASLADPERIEKEQALTKEKRALLKELLGTVPDEKPDLAAITNPMEAMLDFLPGEKQTQIMEVMQKYSAKMMKGFSGGAPDAEDLKQMQKTQKEMEAELAKVLTPQELEDYQLRLSQTAMVMRMQLASFDPNEQEFRDVFKLKKTYDDEFGLMGMSALGKAEKEKADAAKKDMDAQIKTLLGDTRYADYERSQDYAYQGIAKVAERNGLARDDAIKVYDMKKLAENQANKVRADQTLSPEQRTATLQGIRTETENSIRTVFGQKAFDSYVNQPGTYWLKGISPDPKSTTPTPTPP